MSYLEELLPEFRKGAKIRCVGWSKEKYIYIPEPETGELLDETGRTTTIPFRYVMENFWEFYQEPIDFDYIIKNKCLCWFWDDAEDKPVICDVLIEMVSGRFSGFRSGNGSCWKHCRPVRRDEVTFYEEKKDEI